MSSEIRIVKFDTKINKKNITEKRHLSVVDSVSQFGAEIADLARVISMQEDAINSTLISLDDWGYGTLSGSYFSFRTNFFLEI